MMRTRVASLLGLLVLGGCAGGDAPAPVEPPADGQLALTLARAANSQVPAAAESALVRVWNPAMYVNHVTPIAIPTPGATNTVAISVPPGTGYSVGVIAFDNIGSGLRHAVAAGQATNVTVQSSVTTTVPLTVAPWSYALAGPDTAISGQPVTYTLTIADGPVADFFGTTAVVHVGLTSGPSSMDPQTTRSGNAVAVTFDTPTVAADTAMYLTFGLYVDQAAWQSTATSFAADLPYPALGQQPFRRPIKLPPGSITVNFGQRARDAGPRRGD